MTKKWETLNSHWYSFNGISQINTSQCIMISIIIPESWKIQEMDGKSSQYLWITFKK